MSSILNPNKKPRGRPPVDSEQFGIRLERPQIDALDAFLAKRVDIRTRPAAIRAIVNEWLTESGYLKP